MKGNKVKMFPDKTQIEAELKRERYKNKYKRSLKGTIYTLITVAATAVLVATLWMPVLRIYGNSMKPVLNDGEIVVSTATNEFSTGDIVAFYYNNKVLVKRVIATAGQWVDIDADGTVYINGKVLNEPYVKDKSFGDCDISLPYQVPENKIFVMGDYRSVSVDSRNTVIGCVSEEQIVGKIIFRVWPFDKFGTFN